MIVLSSTLYVEDTSFILTKRDLNMNTRKAELIEFWKQEAEAPFAGWDFSYVTHRIIETEMPWSYEAQIRTLLPQVTAVLDMGTGGGEKLLKFRDLLPENVVATEDYPPNVQLATEQLSPFGIRVVDVELGKRLAMPFSDAQFDLVINRQSAFNLKEVERILSTGGHFVTQQIDESWAYDLILAMGGTPAITADEPSSLDRCLHELCVETGLRVQTAVTHNGTITFTDIGALVYYLNAIPWIVPNFSLEIHLSQLLTLQQKLDRGDPLQFHTRKHLIQAQKP